MTCPSPRGDRPPTPARALLGAIAVAGLILATATFRSIAQEPAPVAEKPAAKGGTPDPVPGQFFAITEPINSASLEEVRTSSLPYIERLAAQGDRPVLVFEIRPGKEKPGQSPAGASWDLAQFLSTKLNGARRTVAYVPEPLSGYAVLVALACDEVVMGPEASLGPITPEGEMADAGTHANVKTLARRKGKDESLLLGMLDREADLRQVRTADRRTHYVLAPDLDSFKRVNQVIDDQPAWEGGRRGVLTAERAREGFASLLAEDRTKIREVYNLPSTADDPTLGGVVRPVRIRIDGRLDAMQESYLGRRIKQARQEKVNLVFFELNSIGGVESAANNIAELISNTKDMKTVAFINNRATNLTTLVALACDEIVFAKDGLMGEVQHRVVGADSTEPFTIEELRQIAKQCSEVAHRKGHPEAVAYALADPEATLLQARDTKTGAVVYVLQTQIDLEPQRYVPQETVEKKDGEPLMLSAENALTLGMARRIVNSPKEVWEGYGVRGDVRIDGPTWVDSLVTLLNTPWMSWLLLFTGMFMLILELKMPGIGLPGILSALAFLLFFWGHYLSGTADQLEIMLFLGGLVCIALELFVFPGFGVFGMSGILLVLVSVVMASHTFIWPTQEYEFRQMGQTLFQVTFALVAVVVGAVVVGRFLPSIPLFNRIVLMPEPLGEPEDPSAKPSLGGDSSYFYLLGETGRSTTALKPMGKARFGELLIDVNADGFYIEPDSLVEVVEVHGSKVTVKRVTGGLADL